MSKFIVVIFILESISVSGQKICKVRIEALQGTYIGDCKKGYANGKGKATGTDSYIGEFRNGYPHGKGTYDWNNDDIYEGEWKKGKKHGQGKLIILGDTLSGYWHLNEFIGTSGIRYKLESSANNIAKVTFIRIGKRSIPFYSPKYINCFIGGSLQSNPYSD